VLATVLALTLGALALRVAGLGRLPLWLDEGYSLQQVTYRPLSDWLIDVHPPLYTALLWAWTRVAVSDAWLRLLSALLGAATVPAVYVLGARLLGRAYGLWAAGFLAVTWFHVLHSRQARMYPLLVLTFTLALWGLVDAIPGLKVPDTIKWEAPLTYQHAGAGWLVLLFRVMVIVPVVSGIGHYLRDENPADTDEAALPPRPGAFGPSQ
jgi:uncharacterized membrane protein